METFDFDRFSDIDTPLLGATSAHASITGRCNFADMKRHLTSWSLEIGITDFEIGPDDGTLRAVSDEYNLDLTPEANNMAWSIVAVIAGDLETLHLRIQTLSDRLTIHGLINEFEYHYDAWEHGYHYSKQDGRRAL